MSPTQTLDYLERVTWSLESQKKELDTKIQSINDALNNTKHDSKWKSVKKVNLQIGQTYIIRRVWSDKSVDNPVVSKWTENGWQDIHGRCPIATGKVDIQVLV